MARWALVIFAALFAVAFASNASAQRRLNPPHEWITAADFPDDKRVAPFDSITRVQYQISETGRVDKCTVKYTDVVALGKLACKLIAERALYAPAADKSGKPIRSKDLMTVEWGRPPATTVAGTIDFGGAWPLSDLDTLMRDVSARGFPLRQKGSAYFRFRIGTDGRVGECVAAALQGRPEDAKYICGRFQANTRFAPPVDATGNPYSVVATVKFIWERMSRSKNAW
jgi:hypothetical protein